MNIFDSIRIEGRVQASYLRSHPVSTTSRSKKNSEDSQNVESPSPPQKPVLDTPLRYTAPYTAQPRGGSENIVTGYGVEGSRREV